MIIKSEAAIKRNFSQKLVGYGHKIQTVNYSVFLKLILCHLPANYYYISF